MFLNPKYLLFFFLTISICFAQETVSVTVTGYGTDPATAEKSAIQKAVRKALGEFVDAETITNNDEIIKDQVLTYSDGFVASKKILSGPEKDPDLGLFVLTIEANVIRNKLIQRLRESKITVSGISGDDLWTQAISKVANVQDGRALLDKFLNEELLPERLLVAEVVSEDSSGNLLRGNTAQPSHEPDYDSGTSELTFFVEIKYDLDAYYKKVMPRMSALLKKICRKEIASGITISPMSTSSINPKMNVHLTNSPSIPTKGMNWLGFESKRFSSRVDKLFFGQTNRPLWSLDLSSMSPEKQSLFVALNTGRNGSNSYRFDIFQLDGRAYAKFFMEAPACKSPDLSLSLLDGKDEIIFTDTSPILEHFCLKKGVKNKLYIKQGFMYSSKSSSSSGSAVGHDSYYCSTLSPWFQDHKSYLTESPVIERKITLGEEDLKRLSKVQLKFGN